MSGYLYVIYKKHNFAKKYTFDSILMALKTWEKAQFPPNISFSNSVFFHGEKCYVKKLGSVLTSH